MTNDKSIAQKVEKLLKHFDICKLDMLEMRTYSHAIKSMPKESVLQMLINNVEGDYSQLSPELAKIAVLIEPHDPSTG